MFGTIRKHQSWLWIVIVAAVILSFVVWFSPNQTSYRNLMFGDNGSQFGMIDGRPITQEMVSAANRQTALRRFLYNRGQTSGADDEQQILQQLFLTEKVREYKIGVGDAAVAHWIQQNFRNPQTGQLNYEPYLQELQKQGFSEADFHQFIRQDIGQRHLGQIVGVAGKLTSPREAETEYRRGNEESLTSVVLFNTSNFLDGVTIQRPAVEQFFSNRVSSYRIPERLQMSFVRFATSNYFAEAEKEFAAIPNLTNALENSYAQQGADAFRGADGKTLSKEAALLMLRDQNRDALALRTARTKAAEFAKGVYDMTPAKAENLEKFAAANGLISETSEPFSRFTPPLGLEDVRSLTEEAFKLAEDQPFTAPIVSDRGVYVFALKKRLPSEVPAIEQVRTKVVEDYRRSQAMDMGRKLGMAFQAAVTNSLAQGKSFDSVAKQEGLEVVELPPISLSTQSLDAFQGRVDLNSVKNVAFGLKPRAASDFITTREGGMVVYLKERRPVSEEKVKAELPKFLEDLRRQNESQSFGEWFNSEFERSGLANRSQARQKSGASPMNTP
ncbi:MAG: hypothetical protein EXS36_06375 [Pedosphaera sp.]|nr:hypothetical protein [Pedosphaera sp.]